jgi:CheY-like chemotaxis protein/nitrogen-specific signal transduction histidine kinase
MVLSYIQNRLRYGGWQQRRELSDAIALNHQQMETITEYAHKAEEASKSNFLATMSHEIRTPMNAIIGIAQIQLQKEGLPDGYTDAMEQILSSGNNLLGIINDVLDLSKIETGKLDLIPAEYDLPVVINEAVMLNIIRIGSKPIDFILDIDESLPLKLCGDEMRLKQILNNLLSNAFKYTEKGYVKLAVSAAKDGPDTLLRFEVDDSGQGMADEDRKKLFSEYLRFNVQANRKTEGTGLGLSITKRLVELMDGSIEVISEYGKGSIFSVAVMQKTVPCGPIGPDVAEKLKSFAYAKEKNERRKNVRHVMPYGKVLVVDDVKTNLFVAEGLIARYKIQVDTAESGFEAIDKVNAGNAYDIIFMDHMMPKMDGVETTLKLREGGYKAPIVALTANALAGTAEMFMANGFDGYISKPIDIRRLDAALNKFIRERRRDGAEET